MVSLTGGWELMVFRIPSLPDSQFCIFCNVLSEVFWSILGEKLPALWLSAVGNASCQGSLPNIPHSPIEAPQARAHGAPWEAQPGRARTLSKRSLACLWAAWRRGSHHIRLQGAVSALARGRG